MSTAVFPGAIKGYSDKADNVDIISAAHMNDAYAEIIALEKYSLSKPNLAPESSAQFGLKYWVEAPIINHWTVGETTADDLSTFFQHSFSVNTGVAECLDSRAIPIPASTNISISADMYTLGTTIGGVRIEISYYTSANTLITFGSMPATLNTGWTRYFKQFTTPANTSYVRIRLVASGTTETTLKGFKRIKLELGSTNTMYSQEADIKLVYMYSVINPNLVTESTAQFKLNYWSGSTKFTYLDGTYSGGSTFTGFRVTTGNSINASIEALTSAKITVAANTNLYISFEAYTVGVTAGIIYVALQHYNSSNTLLREDQISLENQQNWKAYGNSYTTPASTSYVKVVLGISANITNSADLGWRKIKLEYGTNPTTYTQEADIKAVYDDTASNYIRHPAFAITTGTANTYIVATTPAPTQLVDGMGIVVKANFTNTGASTLVWDALTSKPIFDVKGNALIAGKMTSGLLYHLRYNATGNGGTGNFQLLGEGSVGTALNTDLLEGKTAEVTSGLINGAMIHRTGNTATLSSVISGTTLKLLASGGYRDGVNDYVTITDSDFITNNIPYGVNLFGLTGDFSNIYTVQRGTFTKTGITDNIIISSVNTSTSIVIITYQPTNTAAQSKAIKAKLTSNTNLQLTSITSSAGQIVDWQVISFNSFYTVKSLQKGDITTGTGTTVTISSINTAKSFLVFSYTDSNNLSPSYGVRGNISSATQLTFEGSGTSDTHWQAVEFN